MIEYFSDQLSDALSVSLMSPPELWTSVDVKSQLCEQLQTYHQYFSIVIQLIVGGKSSLSNFFRSQMDLIDLNLKFF
jgi:hypothetical protein